MVFAIRGATTINSDTKTEIEVASLELIEQIMKQNDLEKENIVSILCSQTSDIASDYPARFIRESGKMGDAPLFSSLEPPVVGSLPKCIRLLITVLGNSKPKHIYLNGATILRPDL